MKQLILMLLLIACYISSVKSQNRFDKPIPSTFINTYVSPDWNNLNKAYEYAKSLHDRNAQIVDNMIDAVYNLRRQSNNDAFKFTLDEFLTKLKNLRLGNLVNAEPEIKKIDWALRDEIEKFNSGSYASTKNEESYNEEVYSSGSYVETMGDSPIRDRPDISGKEIAYTTAIKFVKIKNKIGDNFYAIEFDDNSGYLSKSFLWRSSTKENYDQFYSNKKSQVNQDEFQTKYKLSEEAYSRQDFATARKYIDELLTKSETPELYYTRGWIYSSENNIEKAVADYTKSITLNPNDPRYYYARGNCYYHSKDLKNALIDYSTVVKIDPTITDAHFLKGLIKSELGDRRGAIRDYDLVIANHIDTIGHNYDLATVFNNKAYCLVELGEYTSALPLVNKALELDQKIWYIWDTRGELN